MPVAREGGSNTIISKRVNASPLTQTFPLFRDKSGVYHFPDTISVFGEFGFAMNVVDKREGTNNIYQFHRAELMVDGNLEFELSYDRIPFNQGKFAKTMIEYDLKRKNLGEFQKLYRLPEHRKISITHQINQNIGSCSGSAFC